MTCRRVSSCSLVRPILRSLRASRLVRISSACAAGAPPPFAPARPPSADLCLVIPLQSVSGRIVRRNGKKRCGCLQTFRQSGRGAKQDRQVTPEGLLADVLKVEADPVLEGVPFPSVDLPEAGQPGLDAQPGLTPAGADAQLALRQGTRPD